MVASKDNRGILFDEDAQMGPFPLHLLKRVDKPTTLITDNIQRFDMRETAILKAERGEYGAAAQKAAPMPFRYPLSVAQAKFLGSLASFKGRETTATRAPITEDPLVLTRHIKRLGYFLGADIMAVCRFPQYAAYSHVPDGPVDINYQNAIVMVVSKDIPTIAASKGYDWIGDPISFSAYVRLAVISEIIAAYINELGYPALPQHMSTMDEEQGGYGGYQIVLAPLLVLSGIGEVSRTGLILNPFLGIAFKASAVLTDLPLVPDKPIDFGLQDFCQHCTICAQHCPSQAIPTGDKVMYNGYETWEINYQRCASFSILNKRGTMCGMCTKVCPWTRPHTWPQKLWRWANWHSGLARRLSIKSAGRRAEPQEAGKWWFDLTYKDGKIKIPRQKG